MHFFLKLVKVLTHCKQMKALLELQKKNEEESKSNEQKPEEKQQETTTTATTNLPVTGDSCFFNKINILNNTFILPILSFLL